MTQMRLTAATRHFRAGHSMCVIGRINNTSLADWLVKAGPAASAFEFGITFKQRVAADGAKIGSHLLRIFKFAGPGSFSSLFPRNGIYVSRQDLPPFFITHIQL